MASEEREEVMYWATEVKDVRIRLRNHYGQSDTWLACKQGNLTILEYLYKMGESLHGNAYEFPGASGQSPYDIASTNQHEDVAKLVQANTGEGNKVREANSLRWYAKNAIREALAQDGRNIWPKVNELELPKALKTYLVELE